MIRTATTAEPLIGIHERAGSFSDRWSALCEQRGVPYRLIDCLDSDVIRNTVELKGVLWHWAHDNPAEALAARSIIAALESSGKRVFPSSKTCWHFDDKMAQKYLLESVGAPYIDTWVFTDRERALDWCHKTDWPKVFKLRRGAGSCNVRLVRDTRSAVSVVERAFSTGFPVIGGYLSDYRTRAAKVRGLRELVSKLKRAPSVYLKMRRLRRISPREIGYVYFQEYLPNNPFDTRITVIGNRAFGYRRMNRPNDFRASGSGRPLYQPELIDLRCVEIAHSVSRTIGSQSLAFDFLFDAARQPRISEISYCYVSSMVHECEGYWDMSGNWTAGHSWPEERILEDFLGDLGHRKNCDMSNVI